MSLRRRIKSFLRILRIPFEWLGIGLGILTLSYLPRRGMLWVCDLLSGMMYRLDRSGRKLALFNLRVILGAEEVRSLPFARLPVTRLMQPTAREEKIIRRSYRNMARSVGHAFWTCRRAKERAAEAGEMSEAGKRFLAAKKGFLLVSHDRDLLDAVCDHMLVLNRKTIEVQTGNFSTWWENKERSDAYARAENERHIKEIGKLKAAVDRSSRWAAKSENRKIGFDPVKENDRSISTRSYIGAKTKKMQARVRSYEKRVNREIEEMEGLLQEIEKNIDLKLNPLRFHKEILVDARDLSLRYEGAPAPLFEGLRFQIRRGERLVLSGENGSGKSSLIKAILRASSGKDADINGQGLIVEGILDVASGLTISYINQDTSFLSGYLEDYCEKQGLDKSIFLAILRQLDLGRDQFAKRMEDFSEGQKKKVLIAASLLTPAHLYIWDEPLNYIDVFSRMQIEKLILDHQPTMLLVEHDVRFREKTATQSVRLGS